MCTRLKVSWHSGVSLAQRRAASQAPELNAQVWAQSLPTGCLGPAGPTKGHTAKPECP